MSLTARRLYYQVLINDTPMKVTDGVTVTEALGSFCTTAEFELLEQPTSVPADGDTVEIRQVDLDTDEYIVMFGGYITIRGVNTNPRSLLYRAIDELHKFSAIRTTNDLDLTGMTDGEAWEAIAGVCDVDFDPLDISDSGYILGAEADIYWRKGASGGSVIAELDRVFGYKTMTVLNNRVIRIPYDRVAHSADIQTTFNKEDDSDYFAFYQETADSSAVQSEWIVQGGQFPCGTDDECTCMPWAHATDTVPKKGKKVKAVGDQTFQSDLIQDEELAREIARRLMRWYNRVPITARLETLADPNIHPCCVIGVYDPTYGIGHTSTRPYFVENVDKRGQLMTLTLVGTSDGDAGTITTGVEQRCNDFNLDLNWPGGWDFPTLDFPPIGTGAAWGGTVEEGVDVYGNIEVVAGTWENESTNPVGEDFTISGNSIRAEEDMNPVAHVVETIPAIGGMPSSFRCSWSFRTGTIGISTDAIEILAEDANDPGNSFAFWLSYFPSNPDIYWLNGADYEGYGTGIGHDFGSVTANFDCSVVVEWERSTETFTVTVDGGTGSPFSEAVPTASGTSLAMTSGEVKIFAIANNGVAGDFSEVNNFTIEVLE